MQVSEDKTNENSFLKFGFTVAVQHKVEVSFCQKKSTFLSDFVFIFMADSPGRLTPVQTGQCKFLALSIQSDCSWWTTLNGSAAPARTVSGSLPWTSRKHVRQRKTAQHTFHIKLDWKTHRLCSVIISGLRGSRNILGNDKIPPDGKPTVMKKTKTFLFLKQRGNVGKKVIYSTVQIQKCGAGLNLLSKWRLVMPFSVSVASMVEIEEGKM